LSFFVVEGSKYIPFEDRWYINSKRAARTKLNNKYIGLLCTLMLHRKILNWLASISQDSPRLWRKAEIFDVSLGTIWNIKKIESPLRIWVINKIFLETLRDKMRPKIIDRTPASNDIHKRFNNNVVTERNRLPEELR
jgi:hypothetical protein